MSFQTATFHNADADYLSPEDSGDLIRQMTQNYGLRVTKINQRVLEPGDFHVVGRRYLVCLDYSVSSEWLLGLFTFADDEKYTLYINMATKKVIRCKTHRFADELYQGTVFRGVIVGDTF